MEQENPLYLIYKNYRDKFKYIPLGIIFIFLFLFLIIYYLILLFTLNSGNKIQEIYLKINNLNMHTSLILFFNLVIFGKGTETILMLHGFPEGLIL
jgi:hypothetical protein